MKTGYTDISIVLDRSGSMESVRSDTIGGFNTFLSDQLEEGGEATITLVQFDDIYEVVYSAIPLTDAGRLDNSTFVPRGSTALLDAIGRTIIATGKRLEALAEDQRPEKVVFVVLTDGHENASRQFTAHNVNEMISHQRDVYKWEFVFLGANQDAITTAANLGIQASHSITYAATPAGVQQVFKSVSKHLADYRAGVSANVEFSDEDREEQRKAGLTESKNKA
jgi:hypothetical protein